MRGEYTNQKPGNHFASVFNTPVFLRFVLFMNTTWHSMSLLLPPQNKLILIISKRKSETPNFKWITVTSMYFTSESIQIDNKHMMMWSTFFFFFFKKYGFKPQWETSPSKRLKFKKIGHTKYDEDVNWNYYELLIDILIGVTSLENRFQPRLLKLNLTNPIQKFLSTEMRAYMHSVAFIAASCNNIS